MQNPECATQYSNDQFSISAKARSMFQFFFFFYTYEHLNTRHFLTLNAFYMHLRHASS